MLANGAKLGFKANGTGSTYTDLPGLMEIPEIGMDPEKVDVTCLTDTAKKYEYGIGDYGDLEFTFKYDNSAAGTAYRTLRTAQTAKKVDGYELTLADGTKFDFTGYCNVKVKGGKVNDAITFTVSIALQSAITIVDPA